MGKRHLELPLRMLPFAVCTLPLQVPLWWGLDIALGFVSKVAFPVYYFKPWRSRAATLSSVRLQEEVCERSANDRLVTCQLPEICRCLPPEWLKDPGPRNEKRTLFCDMVCFLFITPLAAISGWLCLRGAQDHLQFNSRLEAIGLIALTIALFTIYVLWTLVSFRYHCQLYSEWRRTNQKVRLMIPASRSPHPVPHSLLSAKLLKKTADETTV
ncbi:E3 ubiquitin-protein ligase MARCHF2 isoform X3 [Anser cygnoides]|uniref:E3 ubiquitin-protein ligase MARCHF2 isoform X3 n=1 Tax=Anser cygnoides TaxID=8845 RepID=UPI0034D1C1CE